MGIFDKNNLIELNQEDLQDAKTTASLYDDELLQRRAFANVIAARSALKLLFSLNIDATNLYSMYSINKVLERLDIADINVGNIRIDVRLVDNSNEIFIPKSHFDLGIVPDLYLVLRLEKDLSSVEFLGCINPDEIDKTNQNKDYYLVSDDLLYNLKIFKNLVKNDNSIRSNYFLTPENIERAQNLIIPLLDGQIFPADYAFLIRHLAYDLNLRQKCVEFENFEFVSKKVVSDESVYGDSVLGLIGADNLYESNELNTNVDLEELSDTTVDDFVEDFEGENNAQMNELTGEISLDEAINDVSEKLNNDNLENEEENSNDDEDSSNVSDLIENIESQELLSNSSVEEMSELEDDVLDDSPSDFQTNLSINKDFQENISPSIKDDENVILNSDEEIMNEAEEILSGQELTSSEDVQNYSNSLINADEFVQADVNESVHSQDVYESQTEQNLINEEENITLDEFLNSSTSSSNAEYNTEKFSDSDIDYVYADENRYNDDEIEPEMFMNNTMQNNPENLYAQEINDLSNQTNKKRKSVLPQLLILIILITCAYVNRATIISYIDLYFPSIASRIREFNFELPTFDFKIKQNIHDEILYPNFSAQPQDVPQEIDKPPVVQPVGNSTPQVNDFSQQDNKILNNSNNISANVSKLSWEVPESAANNPKMRKYLQIVGRTLKLSLQNDLLVVNEIPFTNKVVLDLKIANSGKLLSSDFVVSSGSKQIDNIILQTVSDTLKYVKPPVGEIQSSYYNFTLIINF